MHTLLACSQKKALTGVTSAVVIEQEPGQLRVLVHHPGKIPFMMPTPYNQPGKQVYLVSEVPKKKVVGEAIVCHPCDQPTLFGPVDAYCLMLDGGRQLVIACDDRLIEAYIAKIPYCMSLVQHNKNALKTGETKVVFEVPQRAPAVGDDDAPINVCGVWSSTPVHQWKGSFMPTSIVGHKCMHEPPSMCIDDDVDGLKPDGGDGASSSSRPGRRELVTQPPNTGPDSRLAEACAEVAIASRALHEGHAADLSEDNIRRELRGATVSVILNKALDRLRALSAQHEVEEEAREAWRRTAHVKVPEPPEPPVTRSSKKTEPPVTRSSKKRLLEVSAEPPPSHGMIRPIAMRPGGFKRRAVGEDVWRRPSKLGDDSWREECRRRFIQHSIGVKESRGEAAWTTEAESDVRMHESERGVITHSLITTPCARRTRRHTSRPQALGWTCPIREAVSFD